MNKLHREILASVRKGQGILRVSNLPEGYSGTSHYQFGSTNPQKRKIAKDWIKKHPGLSLSEFLDLLDSLYQGNSLDEKTIAGMFLGYLGQLRRRIKPSKLNEWISHLEGWEEIDSLCQSNFTARKMLEDWSSWQKLLREFARDKNINKKRASLVLLTKPVRELPDPRLANIAFKNIEILKKEKYPLITKAISWLLRELIKNHRGRVKDYLNKNVSSLPAVAVRETRNKLSRGRKS